MPETLEDQLRRATRHFTTKLPEDEALAIGRDVVRELARAHGETPPRFPDVDPATIAVVDGKPRLEGGAAAGDPREALFRLGAIVHWAATGQAPAVSWRLDGPPPAELSTVFRRGVIAALGSPQRDRRFASGAVAALPRRRRAPRAPAVALGSDVVGAGLGSADGQRSRFARHHAAPRPL